jgi:hypothetical protein
MNGIYLSFIVIGLGIYFMIKPSIDSTRTYNNTLKIVNAKCVCICKYISGLPDLTENMSCYLFADDEKITVVPTDNRNIKISLQLSKIKNFRIFHGLVLLY